MKVFNINDNVKVKLTESGKLTYIAYLKRFMPSVEYPEADENGHHTFQMWVLMSIFGANMYNGGAIQFEGVRVLIKDVDLTEWEG